MLRSWPPQKAICKLNCPKLGSIEVSAVTQWVKNPTVVAQVTWMAQVTWEAQIQSLARELPYAVGAAIKKICWGPSPCIKHPLYTRYWRRYWDRAGHETKAVLAVLVWRNFWELSCFNPYNQVLVIWVYLCYNHLSSCSLLMWVLCILALVWQSVPPNQQKSPFSQCWGMARIVSVGKWDTWTWGDIDKDLYFCRRVRVLKKHVQRRKDPPYLSLTQVVYLSPPHWSSQGTHSSRLANWNKLLLGEEGKRRGLQKCLSWNRSKME